MWELDHKEGWAPKNWWFWTVVLEKSLESPLDSKEIKLSNPKENQLWMFIGGTDTEAEAPKLWPPDVKSWLIGKDLDARKGWGQRRRWLDGIRVWANSRRQWRTGKGGMLWSTGSQRVGHNLVTEQQWQPSHQSLIAHNPFLTTIPTYLPLTYSSPATCAFKYTSYLRTSPLTLPGMLFAQVSAVFPHFLQASAQMTSSHEGLPWLLYKPATPTVSTIFSLTAEFFSTGLIAKWSHNIVTCLLLIIFFPTRTQAPSKQRLFHLFCLLLWLQYL